LVEGEEREAARAGHPDVQDGDASERRLLEMGEDALDERVAGGEEIQRLLLDRFPAIERAEEARSALYAGQAVHDGLVPEIQGEDAPPALALHLESDPLAGGHDDVFVERVELRGDAR